MADLDMLADMGFDREKSALALKRGGNYKSLEELQRADAAAEEPPALKPGEVAHSLVCNDCGKRFRSQAQAEFHAGKSNHTDFSESTEEIAPLTEEEKSAKLAELRERAAAKRATQSEQDKADQKRNEEIRRKSTKEQQDAKEHLELQERLKEAAATKREKQAELDAKKRVQAKIAADREERRRKQELEKQQREAQMFPAAAVAADMPAAVPVPAAAKPSTAYTEARLRLATPSGTLQQTFAADTTLFEVAHTVEQAKGMTVSAITSNFPKKTWDRTEFGQTLREAGLVPSAALNVR